MTRYCPTRALRQPSEDAEDVAAFDAAMADDGANIPWEQVKARAARLDMPSRRPGLPLPMSKCAVSVSLAGKSDADVLEQPIALTISERLTVRNLRGISHRTSSGS